MSIESTLLIFLFLTIAMFIAVVIIFNVWTWVLLVYFLTLVAVSVIHLRKEENPVYSRRFAGTSFNPRRKTIYSSRMPHRNDYRKEAEENELRKKVEREFEQGSVYDNAEDLK